MTGEDRRTTGQTLHAVGMKPANAAESALPKLDPKMILLAAICVLTESILKLLASVVAVLLSQEVKKMAEAAKRITTYFMCSFLFGEGSLFLRMQLPFL